VSPANGVSASDPQAQFNDIVELEELGIAYLHVVEGERDVAPSTTSRFGVSSRTRTSPTATIWNSRRPRYGKDWRICLPSADRSSPIRILSSA